MKSIKKELRVERYHKETVSFYDHLGALTTYNLGKDIAVICFNPATKTIGIARAISRKEFKDFISTLLSSDNILPYPILQIKFVGGDGSEYSRKKIEEIIRILLEIDNDKDIINIISSDTNFKPHPESIRVTAFDGEISEI
ncbi:MAG: hypothetical protein JNK24_05765 [Alphaproteobacteria bacterium]|nr:hypothetical protein [Alphaproteobacteria bacterium]